MIEKGILSKKTDFIKRIQRLQERKEQNNKSTTGILIRLLLGFSGVFMPMHN